MLKHIAVGAAVALLSTTCLFGQIFGPQTATALIPATGPNQLNTLPSCLIMTAQVAAPGAASSSFPGFLTLFSPSSTWAYECDGTVSGVAPGLVSFVGSFEGGANQPFALGITVVPGSRSCGGAAGACMTSGSLFATTTTPYGLLHLDLTDLTLVHDSISGPDATLNAFGSYTLVGSFEVNTAANGGAEQRLAIQGICADPTSPSGFLLSACLNLDQWVSN